ncbi:hypothetical protein [Microvirga lotononidis]|uniref:Lipoprotein n=1 Tax=Microvirga lotononidis TaxID=864069 RepID=I4YRD7_9HYPH|nr:hypothetical protein [Microvirga lotononidis]EIM26529.1 hypothetical protein MicloDRAFT_00030780 [Microvirga lotononidis]WQO31213.1 hypothetical protein U0023_33475 [Microvirga lotononidis]
MTRFLSRLVTAAALGVAVLGLSACAGHKELKAPCSLSGPYFSASAFAMDSDCGPLRMLNE